MKAAVVEFPNTPPVFADFEAPLPDLGEVLIRVNAAAISQLVRARAAGTHYSFDGKFPFIVGFDGTGVLGDGRRVYFAMPRAPYGAIAEFTTVREGLCVPIPDELDDVYAAALVNPAVSSWMALRERARMQKGETVLINGATGTSGQLAVQIALHMGASRIIATGRNVVSLDRLKAFGADEIIPLSDTDVLREGLTSVFAKGVDVVLDYLWGESAMAILAAASKSRPAHRRCRFVQIGSITGNDIPVSGNWLRSSAIELMGSGMGSVSVPQMMASARDLLSAAHAAKLEIATVPIPLPDVSAAWDDISGTVRQVITTS